MRWRKSSVILSLALAIGAFGCGGGNSSSSGVTIQISPISASVIINTTIQFASVVSGNSDTATTWSLTCATGITSCGTISSTGLYTAPKTVPTTTSNGTTTNAPTLTITGAAHADTTKTATATITIISGISISISPAAATVGTGEHFSFVATVNNPGCDQSVVNNTCLKVTWSVPTTAGVGSIDANGVYTAPATPPSPSTVTITATSTADTSITGTATVTVVTAVDPTVSSVSPKIAALGSLFQDVYITGTNFISTNSVFVNNVAQPAFVASSSVIRVRISADLLAAPPASAILQITVSRQIGTPQNCSPDVTQCQVRVTSVRPAVVGASPDSIPQSPSGVLSFNVNGGFFGKQPNPVVSATYDGQLRVATVDPVNITRQLGVTIGGAGNSGDFGTAGLHQVAISSDVGKLAVTNLAVQPDVGLNPPTLISSPTTGTSPRGVAINSTTGRAVVANNGSNDITVIDMAAASPTVVAASICTGAIGAVSAPCSVTSGPTGVAVAHIGATNKDLALVANNGSKSVAVVDLSTNTVTSIIPTQDQPVAVGINPVTGRALVAMQTKNYGLVLDLTVTPPVIIGPVSISTGPNSQIAVEPRLNWALATPGGAGSLGIVDLNRQTINNIVSVSRTAGAVTVNVQPSTPTVPQSPLSVQINDAVFIQGVSDNSFNGIFTVANVGPGNATFTYSQTVDSTHPDKALLNTAGTVNYSEPVATASLSTAVQGVGINPETQSAILLNPATNGVVSFFSLIDQSVTPLTLTSTSGTEVGAIAGAFNPLTNTAYVVNSITNTLSVLDPTTPKRLPTPTSVFATGHTPVAVAVDPPSNRLIVVNQGDNTVSIFSLGNSSGIRPVAITETSPKNFVTTSTLSSVPAPSAQTLTVVGMGFTPGSAVRLDGIALSTTLVSDRQLTATVPPSLLMNARRFAVDVQNNGGIVSNATDFTITQSVDVSSGTGCTAAPLPSGVAIDSQQNIAVVTLTGCRTAALINLSNGTGTTVGVGNSPLGVAVIPRLHQAYVSNASDGTLTIIDELGPSIVNTVTTGAGSSGVAADQDTGEVAIANNTANTVTIFNAATNGTTSISTGSHPLAVGFNYADHQLAVATTGSTGFCPAGAVSVGLATATSITSNNCVSTPTSIIYDPSADNFLAAASTGNSLQIVDINGLEGSFRIGINPTGIAYNFLTSTLVSTNTASNTVTVADFLARRIRAVLSLPAPPTTSTLALTGALQFAVDIHPLTNLAVIADTANGRVLFIPAPR